MTIPTLKRINVTSVQELHTWLGKQPSGGACVMLVTHTHHVPQKYVSHEEVQAALCQHGWQSGRKYTLNGTLLGHVISKA